MQSGWFGLGCPRVVPSAPCLLCELATPRACRGSARWDLQKQMSVDPDLLPACSRCELKVHQCTESSKGSEDGHDAG